MRLWGEIISSCYWVELIFTMAKFQNTGHVVIAVLFTTISFTSSYPALIEDFKLIAPDDKVTSELDLSRQKRTLENETLSRQKRVDLEGGADTSKNEGSVRENLGQLSRQKRMEDDDGQSELLSRQKRLSFEGESTLSRQKRIDEDEGADVSKEDRLAAEEGLQLSRQKRIDADEGADVSKEGRLTAEAELQLSRQKRLENTLAESTREEGLSRQKRLQV
ncbi:unnamed protein product [Lymnaea stagnalis]|uniref:Uncharacterized protein n=1 Tax=Lymnaea stagnalis TaxID=6523 RepID=A0AAV2HFH4_LYMST